MENEQTITFNRDFCEISMLKHVEIMFFKFMWKCLSSEDKYIFLHLMEIKVIIKYGLFYNHYLI